jgi:hypothetical protein
MSDCAKGSANFKLIETNGKENVAGYTNTDWTQNKKVYKQKAYSKSIKDVRGYLEHEMTFKFTNPVSIREIQIGMNNYWATDSEVHIEPTSIIVQGGPDKDNLKHIVTLDQIHDNAFLSASSCVFAKNLQ